MTERQAEKWAATRAKGRSRYILLFGVLGWGLTMVVLWTALMVADLGWSSLPVLLPVAAIAFPCGGYLWGATMWYFAERAYSKRPASGQPN